MILFVGELIYILVESFIYQRYKYNIIDIKDYKKKIKVW